MQQYSLPILKKPYKYIKENIRNSLDTSSYIKITKMTNEDISFSQYVLKKQQELEQAMIPQVPLHPQKTSLSRHLPKISEQFKPSPYLIKALRRNRYPTEPVDKGKTNCLEQAQSIDINNNNRVKFEKFSLNSLVRHQARRIRVSPNHKLFASVQ